MLKQVFNIRDLIVKEQLQSLTHEEQLVLNNWINKSDNNKALYNDIIDQKNINSRFNLYNTIDQKQSWVELQKKINRRSKKIWINKVSRWAAAIILPLITAYSVFNYYNSNKYQRFVEKKSNFETKAVLILDDGRSINLEDFKTSDLKLYDNVTTKNKNSQLVYSIPKKKGTLSQTKEIINTVKTSANVNGDYQLILADGTKVWLNGGTRFKFPVQFPEKQRKVYLEGEAYFEVSENTEKPFIVVTNNMSIKALGTSFNVKTYQNKNITEATLIDGSVKISTPKDEVILSPGQQVLFEEGKELKAKEVNSMLFTSWTKGIYIFNDVKLIDITDMMKRLYNVDILYESELSKQIRFTGALDKNKPIDNLIELMEKASSVKFSIADDAILIKERSE